MLLLSGRIANVLVQLVSIRVLTTVLDPEEVGRYYLLLTLHAWVSLALLAAPNTFLQRNFLEFKARRSHAVALVGYAAYLTLGVLVAIPLVATALATGFVTLPELTPALAAVVLWLVAGTSALQSASLLNLMERRIAGVLVLVGTSILGLLGALAATALVVPTAENWLLGLAGGNGVGAVAGAFLVLRWSKVGSREIRAAVRVVLRPSPEFLRKAWNFCWPIAVITALYWAQSQGYRIPLALALDESAVGVFAIAYTVGSTTMSAAETVVMQWVLPPFYRSIIGRTVTEIDEAWRKFIPPVVATIVPIGVFAAFAGPFMVRLLADVEFHSAILLGFWAGIAETLRVFSGIVYSGAVARRRTREIVLPHLPGAVAVLALTYVGAGLIGVHAAGLALVASYAMLVIAMQRATGTRIFTAETLRELRVPLAGSAAMATTLGIALLAGATRSAMWSSVALVVGGTYLAWLMIRSSSRLEGAAQLTTAPHGTGPGYPEAGAQT
jgi:O-antigen/teichoic acid export membrane protein